MNKLRFVHLLQAGEGNIFNNTHTTWEEPFSAALYKLITKLKSSCLFCRTLQDSNVSSSSSTKSAMPKTSSVGKAKTSRVGKAKITHWLLKVLRSPEHNPSVMRWEDEERGIFRVVDQTELGRMWGVAKNNPRMDYKKFR